MATLPESFRPQAEMLADIAAAAERGAHLDADTVENAFGALISLDQQASLSDAVMSRVQSLRAEFSSSESPLDLKPDGYTRMAPAEQDAFGKRCAQLVRDAIADVLSQPRA